MMYQAPYNHIDCLVAAGWVSLEDALGIQAPIPYPYWTPEEIESQLRELTYDGYGDECLEDGDLEPCEYCGGTMQYHGRLKDSHEEHGLGYNQRFSYHAFAVCDDCGCGFEI